MVYRVWKVGMREASFMGAWEVREVENGMDGTGCCMETIECHGM